jgi:hypothetical protein
MFGQGEHELELHVPASEAWDLFSGLRIGKVLEKEMPDKFQKVELIEGDGGVGTILKVIFTPGKSYTIVYIKKILDLFLTSL